MFDRTLKAGTHVRETLNKKQREYVFQGDRSKLELSEIDANTARKKLYGPPDIKPGEGLMLGSEYEPLPINPLAAKAAPEFPPDAKWIGTPVKLEALRGKVTILMFWATWNDFWIDGMDPHQIPPPSLKLPSEIAQDAVVIGIHVPTQEPDRVRETLKQNHWDVPVCLDASLAGKGWGVMADAYRVEDVPAFYVIDQEGRIAAWGNWQEAVRRAGELLGKSHLKAEEAKP